MEEAVREVEKVKTKEIEGLKLITEQMSSNCEILEKKNHELLLDRDSLSEVYSDIYHLLRNYLDENLPFQVREIDNEEYM